MFSSSSPGALAAVAALRAAVDAVAALDGGALGVRERLEIMLELETASRRQAAVSHALAASLDRCDEPALGGICHKVIADVLRISPRAAARRLRDAARLSPRATLGGGVLPPDLPATAKAWQAGILDGEHLRVITAFIADLPEDIHPAAASDAEAFLAEKAAELRPDQLAVLAERLALRLNPDGRFSEEDRARKRGFGWCGRQRPDGMSVGRLIASPELRATIDALLAKFAAPGMCNPDDAAPLTDGEPDEERAARDERTVGQRQHDALHALLRDRLGDPALGRHNGLPVTVIASVTVADLHDRTGHAVTAGGTLLPIPDLIRMAAHAWHYLTIFDGADGRPLWLGRAKRIASADQRIVLHSRDRGCTAPGCDKPGYLTEVHHNDEWAAGGNTDIGDLTFACGPHHRLLTHGGWATRKRADGRIEWIPPPQLPLPAGINDFHHPERLLPQSPADQ